MVDINVAYFAYDAEAKPQSDIVPAVATLSPESEIVFSQREEKVTAKIKVNLRDWPGTDVGQVVYTLERGEEALRTGVSDGGWSRVEWDGQVLYAVSSYLTTDLSADQVGQGAFGEQTIVNVDGITVKTVFEEVDDPVTAKDVVNLRSLPSTTHENSRILGTLKAGEILKRTGINKELGWSRLEYEGMAVYAITSYLDVMGEN